MTPIDPGSLWVASTVLAALAQTARNATQRELTRSLGTVGATHVRFLFGFPFALAGLAAVLVLSGTPSPRPGAAFWPWILFGALAQIGATALMLALMEARSFVVTIAYTKTEPVQVALFGLVFLGEHVTLPGAVAILLATAGVMVVSWKGGAGAFASVRPALLGIGSGALFALSAVGFRGAIRSLENTTFFVASSFTLAVALVLQAALLSLYLLPREPGVLLAILRAWRPSLLAGFTGALASEFWFLAFSLTTAANVRTLALVELLFAQAVSVFVFRQALSLRDSAGILLLSTGVGLLVWSA